jgi:hypothetical protein
MTSRSKIMAVALLLAACPAIAAPNDVVFETEGKGYGFSFRYPPVVSQFPKLKAEIDKDRTDALAAIKEDAAEWLKDRPKDLGPITLDRQISWAQVTNLPGYLSLTMDDYRFDGGAHGNFGRDSLIWDKAAGRSLKPVDMFTSKAAFDTLLQTRFCDLLDVERSKKRDGEKVDRGMSKDWTQACPAPSEFTVIVGSSGGAKFNRMAIYVAPYGAGPYSEGDYEINLPITAALIAIVKPRYKAAFAVTPVAKR